MSRAMYKNDYYKTESGCLLPIRWMAWESLLMVCMFFSIRKLILTLSILYKPMVRVLIWIFSQYYCIIAKTTMFNFVCTPKISKSTLGIHVSSILHCRLSRKKNLIYEIFPNSPLRRYSSPLLRTLKNIVLD